MTRDPGQTVGMAARARPRRLRACAALVLALPSGCGMFSGGPGSTPSGGGPANGFASGSAGGGVASDEYVIGPGDRLGVFVYDQPQLTLNDVPVRPDGRVSTPLVSDGPAAGKPPAELAADLSKRLEKYVRDPNVTVIVHEFVGPFDRQVRVIGEAADPQAIPYREHMTVLDVMIQTKGLTRFAAGNSAVIVRRAAAGSSATTRIPVRLSDLVKDGDIAQNVEMRPGDTLIIPQSWF